MPRASEKLTNERRNEILNACERLYKNKAFKDIILRDISNETSLTRTSIYNYFETKEEIFLELFEREYKLLNDDLLNTINTYKKADKLKLADVLSKVFGKRELMLKLLALNLYDMEDYSRKERLISFKTEYGQSVELLKKLIKHFYKNISSKDTDLFVFSFLPFLHGVYPYTHHTKKQLAAMDEAKVKYKKVTVTKMIYDALLSMLP